MNISLSDLRHTYSLRRRVLRPVDGHSRCCVRRPVVPLSICDLRLRLPARSRGRLPVLHGLSAKTSSIARTRRRRGPRTSSWSTSASRRVCSSSSGSSTPRPTSSASLPAAAVWPASTTERPAPTSAAAVVGAQVGHRSVQQERLVMTPEKWARDGWNVCRVRRRRAGAAAWRCAARRTGRAPRGSRASQVPVEREAFLERREERAPRMFEIKVHIVWGKLRVRQPPRRGLGGALAESSAARPPRRVAM